MQFDEKWAFVGKKQARCDLEKQADHHLGDCWDHVAFDAEHRLVLGMICGKRSATRVLALARKLKEQLQGRVPRLITTDEFAAYQRVLELVFGPQVAGKRGQKGGNASSGAKLLNYATVHKRRKRGRVVEVTTRAVWGSQKSIAKALKQSTASTHVNTSFIERHNATDRHRNARKARRTYRFSKDWSIHLAVGYFTCFSYNFCWCVRTLAVKQAKGHQQPRTPAMSAGLTDHVWSLDEWLSYPVAGLSG